MSTVEVGVCGCARAWVLLAFQKFPQKFRLATASQEAMARGMGSERIALAPTGLKHAA